MKPTYEELEAQAAAYRQTLIDIKKLGPYIKVPLDLARPEELADEALLSTAGQALLTRLETLEKAFDLACNYQIGCPSSDQLVPWICSERDCDGVQCWKEYFIYKAGEVK